MTIYSKLIHFVKLLFLLFSARPTQLVTILSSKTPIPEQTFVLSDPLLLCDTKGKQQSLKETTQQPTANSQATSLIYCTMLGKTENTINHLRNNYEYDSHRRIRDHHLCNTKDLYHLRQRSYRELLHYRQLLHQDEI